MTPGAQARLLLAKETRALLPIWMACVLTGSVAAFMDGVARDLSVGAFGAGMIALGAYSIGHEYVHRTLGLMLTLPAERRRVFVVKLVVLGAMVLSLAGYASLLRLFAPDVPPWLVAVGALCLAPSFTMLSRNPLAAVMFSIWISIMLLAAVMMILVGRWDAPADVERAAFVIWWRVMVVVFAGGAVLGWRLFKRLEWVEAGVEISLPWRPGTTRDIAPARPLWQLLTKELRLQRMAFGLAAWYLVVFAAEVVIRLVRPDADLPVLASATLGYWLCLPVLMGSIASAEERQLGTRAWQLLLPSPAWQQWAVKAGTVFGLTLLLGIAVPVLALQWLGPDDRFVRVLPNVRTAIVLGFVLSAVSLYVSSLSRSGVWAAVLSFAAITTLYSLAEIFAQGVARTLFLRPSQLTHGTDGALAMLAIAGVLLVQFAFVNHRSEEPGTARVWKQTMWLGGFMVLAIVLIESRPF